MDDSSFPLFVIFIVFFSVILFGIAGFVIGKPKGISEGGAWLGALLGPIGLVIVAFMQGNRKNCQYCNERISPTASVCPHCQRADPVRVPIVFESHPVERRSSNAYPDLQTVPDLPVVKPAPPSLPVPPPPKRAAPVTNSSEMRISRDGEDLGGCGASRRSELVMLGRAYFCRSLF